MSNITLRIADKPDAPLIYGFLQKLAAHLGTPGDFKGSLQALEDFGFGADPAFEAILACREGSAVGCVLFFREFSSWRCSPGIYIQDLFVDAHVRGLGLGKRLIEAVADRARQMQASYLRLSVDAGNQSGLAFYQATGFKHKQNERIMMLDIKALPGPKEH